MIDLLPLIVTVMLSPLVFLVKKKYKHAFSLLLLATFSGIASFYALQVLISEQETFTAGLPCFSLCLPVFILDKLSAFFIPVICFTMLTGLVYAGGYLKPYQNSKTALHFSMHYFAYLWLGFSMVLVSIASSTYSFLVLWEIMTVSSFILVIFNAEERAVIKAGINYLVQMHVGFILLMTGFLIAETSSGLSGFAGIAEYFSSNSNLPLFLLFFIGFGIKAGFLPFHTWLPLAHPAAPSHVSGIMSGVMIKMGIFGILKILGLVQADLLWIGVTILTVSLATGLYGIMVAIVQRDLKKLLAYSSIENIGIIGIGIGSGTIGLHTGNQALAMLGFGGALLHVLNHSLFKSLLFFNAGAIYQATHTRNLEKMGGLIKRMPVTGILFLIGALAICGLPPFNGFVSEYLIYIGLFEGISNAGLYQSIVLLISVLGLALIGGLAFFCFTRTFTVAWLGQARSNFPDVLKESPRTMLLPQIVIAVLVVTIGLSSMLLVEPANSVVNSLFPGAGLEIIPYRTLSALGKISLSGGVFIVLAAAIYFVRKSVLKKRSTEYGPTWGCGYTAGDVKQQYTATSFSDNYANLAKPLIGGSKEMKIIEPDEYFPEKRSFESKFSDNIQLRIIERPVITLSHWLKKLAVMQTGQIQHYVLYAFVFMIVLFALTYFNIL